MISIYDRAGEVYPLAGYEDFCITHKLDGCDTMSFILNMKNEQYPLLQEEGHVDTDDNRWLIKKIDDDKIDCELDFDFLKGRLYFAYKSETKLLSEVLARHLPSDWTVLGASQSAIRRSISFDACTDFDVIYECIDTYKVRFMWNMKKKTLTVVVPENVASSGEYLTTELNLRSLSFKGDTTEFATRLYCVGKDGMTIEEAQVDDGAGGKKRYGLPYVEDRSYADKVICAYWEDDRYTDPTSMYNDGMEKLKVLANPVRSYECEVLNLAKMAPEEYSFLAFQMHRKLTLVDTDRGVKVEHQIVEHAEYPEESDRDKVTLSCVPDTIQAKLKGAIKSAVSGYTTMVDQKVESAQALLDSKIMMATAMLTGAFGNYPYTRNGELFMMDNPDPQAARVVWRWNINGFGKSSTGIDGPYTTAMTWNDEFITGVIMAMVINAAIVKTGILQSTDGETFYLDLDKGILRMKASALTVAGEGGKDIPITDSVTSSVSQYYLSDSRTELAGGEWSDKTPTWAPGKYIWTRSIVTHANGITEYSPSETGVCITGNDGADGADGATGPAGEAGVGIESMVAEYIRSPSYEYAEEDPEAEWSTTVPEFIEGRYIWTRQKITYTDGTVSYEGEYCLTKTVGDIADDRVKKLNDLLDMEEIARRLTDDWKNEGFFLEDGKLYINASMIKAGILDLALLRLVGDRGGLMEGFGATSKTETKGILMFGPNGLDDEGNAIPPYTLLTEAGWRAQLDDLVSVYVSMFTNGRGLGVVGDARINKTSDGTRGRLTVEGDFFVDDVLQIGKGEAMDSYICLGRNDEGYLYFARLTADGLLTIGNGSHARGTFINGKTVYINQSGADTVIRGRVDFSQADSVSGLGGSSMKELWSGTLTSGSASWSSGGYGWYVVIVKPGSSSSQVSVVVPAGQLGERFQGADNECYTSFYLYERSITFNASNSNGQIKAVYGIS